MMVSYNKIIENMTYGELEEMKELVNGEQVKRIKEKMDGLRVLV